MFKYWFFLFYLLAIQTLAITSFTLKWGIEFGWYMPTTDSIAFIAYIPTASLSDSQYGWFGIGFKKAGSSKSMSNADMITIELSTGEITSRTSTGNDDPEYDNESGFTGVEKFVSGDFTAYKWIRPCDTGLPDDMTINPDTEYKFIYAFGKMGSNGSTLEHRSDGNTSFTLKKDTDAVTITPYTTDPSGGGTSTGETGKDGPLQDTPIPSSSTGLAVGLISIVFII